jgi:hypothetical protein
MHIVMARSIHTLYRMTSMKGEIAKDGGGACDDLYGLKGCGKSKIQTPNKQKKVVKTKKKRGKWNQMEAWKREAVAGE